MHRAVLLIPITLLSITFALGQEKIKTKGERSVVADKSKPIRKGIEDWYAQNNKAFRDKDVAAVMALRTPDFHTLTPDGRTNDFRFMEERTRTFLGRIESWISMRFEIGTITVERDLASAYVNQDTTRMQRFPDGTVHKVQAIAIQRETWRKTPAGWRLYKVDDIKDMGTFVDGVRVGN